MNRMFMLLLYFLVAVPVMAQNGDIDYYVDDAYGYYENAYCEYSDTELEMLSMVVGLFYTHAEEKIVQSLYLDTEIQELVRTYTDEYIASMQGAIDICQGGDRPMTTTPWDYSQFEVGLKEYATMLGLLKQWEVQKLGADPVAESVDALRTILIGDVQDFYATDGWIKKITNMMLNLDIQNPDADIAVDLDIDANSVGTKDATTLDAQFIMGGSLDVEAEGTDITTSGQMSAQMKILDGHMYIKLQNFDLDLGDITFDNQYDAQGFNDMLAGVQFIQGKYIDIPLMPEGGGFGLSPLFMMGDIASQQQFFVDLMTADRLTTYSSDDDTIYAGLNPVACETMSMMGSVSDCLSSWMEMMMLGGETGMLYMKTEGGVTSMGIVPSFAAALQDNTLAQIAGIPLITWQDATLVSINVPLYDGDNQVGSISYNDGIIKIAGISMDEAYDYETGESTTQKTEVDIFGTIIGSTLALEGSVTSDELDASFTVASDGSLEDMTFDMSLSVDDRNEWYPMNFKMGLQIDQLITPTSDVQLTKPQEREILDIQQLYGF